MTQGSGTNPQSETNLAEVGCPGPYFQVMSDSIALSICADGSSPGRKRKRRQHSALTDGTAPSGPTCVGDVIGIAKYHVQRILECGTVECNASENLRAHAMGGFVITTAYSGMGTFEFAGKTYLNEVGKALGIEAGVRIICYASAEIDDTANRVLCNHQGDSRPKHRFGCILERLHSEDRRQVLQIEEKIFRTAAELKIAFESEELSKALYHNKRDDLGSELIRQLSEFLEDVEFADVAWCRECEDYCPVSPRMVPEYQGCT